MINKNKMKIIYWIMILSLFATSLWAINQSNRWMSLAYSWYDNTIREQALSERATNDLTDSLLSILCNQYPKAKSIYVRMGIKVNLYNINTEEYGSEISINLDDKVCQGKRVYKNVKINVE